MDFKDLSYDSHRNLEHEPTLTQTWSNAKTVDYWRHHRMYANLDPLVKAYPKSTWLTVGDGRYGTDANYLLNRGANATASDINETYLKQAKEAGFIADYSVENAERLSFRDGQFDFVLCKESYHHFPRPMVALYEMLRVASTGVILIEPNDQSMVEPYRTTINSLGYWFLFNIKQWIKKKIGRPVSSFPNHYESMGNYVYTISRRELEKVGLGLNLDMIATRGLNDSYVEGVEYEEIEKKGPLFRRIQQNIKGQDKRAARRPEATGLLVAMIFKTKPNAECLNGLRENHFDINILEKNPYIKA